MLQVHYQCFALVLCVRMSVLDDYLSSQLTTVFMLIFRITNLVLFTSAMHDFGGGLAQLVTSLVASTKLINAGPG